MPALKIRAEQASDLPAIHAINVAAFDTPAEAELVDRLRATADPFVSLVAEQNGKLLGHLLMTPVTLDENELILMGLAPMAVMPEYQNQGIGSTLINSALTQCRKLGIGGVVVLGHPDYYPKFGFVPAGQFAIKSEYDVPDEVFMALELQADYFQGHSGVIQYHPAFDEL